MNFISIGRGDFLFESIIGLQKNGHKLMGIVTDVGAVEYKKQLDDFDRLAKSQDVPIITTSSNQKICAFLNEIPGFQIGISGNHRRLISGEVIEKFEHGILNLHGGDLPRYKGNACQAWAILNGERSIAACVHKMLPNELDAGKIISRSYFEVDENTRVTEAWEWLVRIAPTLFQQSLSELEKDPEFAIENSKEMEIRSHRCHERRPEDGKINWNQTPNQILRLVNASGRPYFGAFTFLNGKILKIFSARIGNISEDISAVPGQVIMIGGDYVSIACGNGALNLLSIEYDGIEMNPKQLLKSTRIRLSDSELKNG
jgi:methionyl-tRNA formyltransferase